MAENNPEEQSAQDISERRRHRRIWLLGGLAVLFIIVAVLYAVYWATIARYRITTDDAYVQGNQVAIMSQIYGTVTAVHVDDTDFVHQGRLLVSVDPSDARATLDQAEAKLAQMVRHVHTLYLQEREQKAIITAKRSLLAQSEADYRRARRLLAGHAISKRDFQHARTTWQTAQSQLQQAQSALAALQTKTRGTDVRHQPDVRLAIAAARTAWLNLKRTMIVAPVHGYVAKRTVQVGQRIAPGTPLLAVVPLDRIWIRANFKETQLGDMRIGQPVTATSDLYGDGVTYHGHVEGISPGTGSVFELLPPQNATGNWIKVVQRVPVRISLDADELRKHPLRVGLSMHVTVNIRDTSGKELTRQSTKQPPYQTDVYRHQLDGFSSLIDHIIQANGGNSRKPGTETADAD